MAKGKRKTGLGKRIAAAREQAGLSQTELGKAFGLTRSAVSQWEERVDGAGKGKILAEFGDGLHEFKNWKQFVEAVPE